MDESSLVRLNCQQSKWDLIEGIFGECYRRQQSLGLPTVIPPVSLDPYKDQLVQAQKFRAQVFGTNLLSQSHTRTRMDTLKTQLITIPTIE